MTQQDTRIRVGNVQIDALYDMPFDIDRERVFPAVAAEEWSDLGAFLTDEGKVRLEVVSYLIRSGDQVILCDTGLRTAPGAEGQGSLLQEIAALGVAPADVDVVVFTHLHRDHVGWNVEWRDGEPSAIFPNARHLIQRVEWEHSTSPERRETPTVQEQLLPLERLGLLDLLDGDKQLTDEVEAIATSGHTPGHTSLAIASNGERAFVQGDVVVHHVLLARPAWEPRFDFEPEGARTIRNRELARWSSEHLLIAANHFPFPGYGYVERDGDAWRWLPLS